MTRRPPSVLVAEDSPTQAARIRMLLDGAGFDVRVAGNGLAALDEIELRRPDLVVSDIVMPVMDGVELCRRIKSDERLASIPFVLVTALRSPADIVAGLEAGADNFITKPYTDEHLLARVQRILENAGSRTPFAISVAFGSAPRRLDVRADAQQIVELLLAVSEELSTTNSRLADSERALQEHASYLELRVSERTRELSASLAALERALEERQRLTYQLVRAEEEERRRIAEEIHDDPMQVLAALYMRLELLQRDVDERHRASVEETAQVVREASGRLRRLMFDLRPPALDEDGLVGALQVYLEQFGRETGVRWHVDADVEVEPAEDVRVFVYRIAREALANVRRHARASRVSIRIEGRSDEFHLQIEDDGVGFQPSDLRMRPGHAGVMLMRERAETVGGRFDITSVPGRGTCVSVSVPVRARDGAH